jgi:hypothetical protein
MVGLPWCMPRSTSELELEVLSMLRKNMLVILSGWKRYNFPRIPFRSKGFQHALILSRRREPTARLISHKHSLLPLSARYASSARRLSRQEAPLHAARPCPWRGRDGGGCTGSGGACRCWHRNRCHTADAGAKTRSANDYRLGGRNRACPNRGHVLEHC